MKLRRGKTTPEGADPEPTGATAATPAGLAAPPVPARRRPALIGAGVALVALSGLSFAAIINRADDTQPVVMAKADLRAGQPVTADAVTVTRVHGGEGLATATDVSQVVGKRAVSDIPSGSLVNPGSLVDQLAVGPGYATVTIALKHGSMPASGLHAGQVIRIVTQVAATGPSGAAAGKAQQWKGTVAAVGDRGDDQLTTVDVTTAAADAALVATNPPGSLAVVVDAPTQTATSKAATPTPTPSPSKASATPSKAG